MVKLSKIDLINLDKKYSIKLQELVAEYYQDTEALHIKYDNALLDLLNELGLSETLEQYTKEKQYFWYA